MCALETSANTFFIMHRSVLQDAQGVEEREALARMAANVENPASADSEAYIEKYLRSVLAVENLLTLDRLRQVSGGQQCHSGVPSCLLLSLTFWSLVVLLLQSEEFTLT